MRRVFKLTPISFMSFLGLLFALSANGEGWEGSKVRVPKGTLMCTFSTMQKAVLLAEAGDAASIEAYVESNRCLRAPSDLMVVVVKDASTFTKPELAEVVLDGQDLWVAMRHVECCFLPEDTAKNRSAESEKPIIATSPISPIRLTSEGDDLVKLEFAEDCWVEIKDATGIVLYADLGRSGQPLELVGESPFKILLGYATGTTLTFNNVRVDLAASTRNSVASLTLGE